MNAATKAAKKSTPDSLKMKITNPDQLLQALKLCKSSGKRIPYGSATLILTQEWASQVLPLAANFELAPEEDVNSRAFAGYVGNRTSSDREIIYLLKEMKEGRFVKNGETVKITWDGNIMDGLHRIKALTKFIGGSIEILVVWGLDPAVFPTIDIGLKRNVGHILQAKGFANAPVLARIIKFIKSYEGHRHVKRESYKTLGFTPNDYLEFIVENPDITEVAKEAWRMYMKSRLFPDSVYGGLIYLLSQKDQDKGFAFVSGLSMGNWAEDTALMQVRRRIESLERNKSVRIDRQVKTGLALNAWNAYREGLKPSLDFPYNSKLPEIL